MVTPYRLAFLNFLQSVTADICNSLTPAPIHTIIARRLAYGCNCECVPNTIALIEGCVCWDGQPSHISNERSTEDLWPDLDPAELDKLRKRQEALARQNAAYGNLAEDECGRVVLAVKSIAVPFVGVTASTLVVAEFLRVLLGGPAYGPSEAAIGNIQDLQVSLPWERSARRRGGSEIHRGRLNRTVRRMPGCATAEIFSVARLVCPRWKPRRSKCSYPAANNSGPGFRFQPFASRASANDSRRGYART